jgi:hypothetical protein
MSLSSFAIIFVCVVSTTLSDRTFRITNNCDQKLWIGIQGNPLIYGGGVEVDSRSSINLNVPNKWVCLFYFISKVCGLKMNR